MSKSHLRARVPSQIGRFWHQYTRMRTAIFLLIGVVVLVLIGSFVPQQNTSAQAKVDEFIASHGSLQHLFQGVGLPLTQVFVSPVFFALAILLYVSLGACVLRRFRALAVRTIRRYSRSPQFWGEWGSWMFHAAFFLLLVGALFGKLTGFQGLVEVTAGQTFSESRAGYDQIQEGLLFSGHHSDTRLRLNSFAASYQANGVAADYVSNISVLNAQGNVVTTQDVRVNEPLSVNGVEVFQQDYGWAPHIVVRNPAGQVVYDDFLQLIPGNTKAVGAGVLKVPDFNLSVPGSTEPLQLGGDVAVFPDAHPVASVNADGSINTGATQYTPGGETARFPVLELKLFLGNLGLDKGPQNVNVLDTGKLVPLTKSGQPLPLVMGGTDTLPVAVNGTTEYFTVSFPELRQYSLLMVNKDDGVGLVYLSFFMIMAGLLTKLYLKPMLEHRQRRHRDQAA